MTKRKIIGIVSKQAKKMRNFRKKMYQKKYDNMNKINESLPRKTEWDDVTISGVEFKTVDNDTQYIDFVCHYDKCGTDTYDFISFKQHIQVHVQGAGNKCLWDNCISRTTFPRRQEFHNHIIYHIKRYVLFCPFNCCRRMFSYKGNVEWHLRRVHLISAEGIYHIKKKMINWIKYDDIVELQFIGHTENSYNGHGCEFSRNQSIKKSVKKRQHRKPEALKSESNVLYFNRLLDQWDIKQIQLHPKNGNVNELNSLENIVNQNVFKDVIIELNQENMDKILNHLDLMEIDLIEMKNQNINLEERLNVGSSTSCQKWKNLQKKITKYKCELMVIENIISNFCVNTNYKK
ncbi:hypothetical protein A3Q56_05370 [Intoshia linei]|uniref:C2H2-type domain-containing protein n=1 Tax=Intoshia linei TaxID=1819745 RepID=A0A177AY33_9BILA|nr:hypothetical protein A3Q56_05370 [Intoshia linei]